MVKRYSIEYSILRGTHHMVESSHGEYVKYDDYAKLLKKSKPSDELAQKFAVMGPGRSETADEIAQKLAPMRPISLDDNETEKKESKENAHIIAEIMRRKRPKILKRRTTR